MTYPAFCVDYPEKMSILMKKQRLRIKTKAVIETHFILYVATTVLISYLL